MATSWGSSTGACLPPPLSLEDLSSWVGVLCLLGPYFLLEPHLLRPWLGRGLALAQSTE